MEGGILKNTLGVPSRLRN